jgi:spore coat polysaccharide biosynthesis protein SpsF (cytidylyltransferase family)
MKIVAIVQARMSSTRLRGKVLMPLGQKTVLEQLIDRLSKTKLINQIVIATTTNPEDDVLVNFCMDRGLSYFRGEENNVLSRFYKCAVSFNADIIVRVTSDCPLVDPSIVDQTIKLLINKKSDYSANNLVKTFPHGLDVEVISFSALSLSWAEAKEEFELEHVTQFVRQRPKRFKLENLKSKGDFKHIRVTLDYPSDYELIQTIYESLGNDADYSMIKKLFDKQPELITVNQNAIKDHAKYNKSQKII